MTVEAGAGVEHAVPSSARESAEPADRDLAGNGGGEVRAEASESPPPPHRRAWVRRLREGVVLALAVLSFAASGFLIGDHMRGAEVVRVGDGEISVRELQPVEIVVGLVRLLRDAGIDLTALTASPPALSADGPAATTPLSSPPGPSQSAPSQPGREGEHLVTTGDTLASIAQQYLPPGASVGAFANAIVVYNDIENANLIFVGDVIRIPPS